MEPNPILKKLGFSDDDRLLIIHADDLGLCQAGLSAFQELLDFGLVTSGSVMTPCAWFPSLAAVCRANPAIDMGIHLTLNCEWDACRWRPLSTVNPNSGLIDEEGYMFRNPQETQDKASTETVYAELETQISHALASGIQPTHIDTHMGTVLHPKFLPPYAQLSLQYRLPLLSMRWDETAWKAYGAEEELARVAGDFTRQMQEMGIALHDGLFWMDLSRPEDDIEQAKMILDGLPPGLSRLYIHPCHDTPEARAMFPDWRSRLRDYQIFMRDELRSHIQNHGIHLIHYRDIQKVNFSSNSEVI